MFESLTRYIPQLEQEDSHGEWVFDREHAGTREDPVGMPFVDYGPLARDVERAVYAFVDENPDWDLGRYGKILEENGLAWETGSMKGADASALDGRAVMALLVAAVRAERFCDGALLDFLDSGCVVRWLRRLEEIDGEGN